MLFELFAEDPNVPLVDRNQEIETLSTKSRTRRLHHRYERIVA